MVEDQPLTSDLKPGIEPQGLGEKWLTDHIRFSVHEMNLSRVITMTGPPGSGKSWAALRIGELCGDGFSIDSVVFPGIEYIKKVADPNLKPGTVITWDDAGLGAPARQFWSVLNQSVGLVAQSSRFRRLVVICTLPDQSFLDAQPRKLTNLHFEMIARSQPGSPGIARVYTVETSPKSGKIYYKHPRMAEEDGRKALEMIKFSAPSKDLSDAYEHRKQAYMMAFYQSLIDQVESGGIVMDDYRARMLLLLVQYATRLDLTHGQVARALKIRPDSFSRALRKAKSVTGLGLAEEVDSSREL